MRHFQSLLLALVFATLVFPVQAAQKRDPDTSAPKSTKNEFREIGHAFKNGGRAIGHIFKKAGKAVVRAMDDDGASPKESKK